MFKIQSKDGPGARWKDARFTRKFTSAEDAWAHVALGDPDGVIDSTWNRVIDTTTGKAVKP
jgi:hypothetical protein